MSWLSQRLTKQSCILSELGKYSEVRTRIRLSGLVKHTRFGSCKPHPQRSRVGLLTLLGNYAPSAYRVKTKGLRQIFTKLYKMMMQERMVGYAPL